jgi:hypothetical protein
MAYMLIPLISTVMKAKQIEDSARLLRPKRNLRYPGTEWVRQMCVHAQELVGAW